MRELFAQVLAGLDVRASMQQAVAKRLRHQPEHPLLVIGFGKAARTMATALLASLPGRTMRGLIVPPTSDAAPEATLGPFEVIAGGHPLPDAGSMRAARRALALCREVRNQEEIVYLVSGGGSAMLELPAHDDVDLRQLQEFYRSLVGCGADIDAINTVRRHLSAIKGGRLALAGKAARRQITFAISDVPLTSPATSLASGPTVADPSTLAECRAVIERFQLTEHIPAPLQPALLQGHLPPPLRPDDELLGRCVFDSLLDERRARDAAVAAAHAMGCIVGPCVDVDNWPDQQAADHLLAELDLLRHRHPGKRVAIVTTGELSVPLPMDPGIGGRNLQFALHCATRIANQPIAVMSGGTDGIDGNSPAAGAIVDGSTLARAQAIGLDAHDHLKRCDSYPLLDALQDCLKPGPTGTNVRDVRVLVREA